MSDADARITAVDPTESVIVQAPAGSGKTTLLVERLLTLLARVEHPEEILAITFTRKAAAEMRERVLRYLAPDFDSDAPHEQAPLQKARAIADKVAAWQLLDNPQRLMIRTIDSFNYFLARSMPVATALGPVPEPADDAQALYRQAARRVLAQLDAGTELAADLERLLSWRDHNAQDIETILALLLSQREQWLRALGRAGNPSRERLEFALHSIVEHRLARAAGRLVRALARSSEGSAGTSALLAFAGANLRASNPDHARAALADLTELPTVDVDALSQWQCIAGAFLTTGGGLRKQVTVREGFPPKSSEKNRFTALLAQLTEDAALPAALLELTELPAPAYTDAEWQVLDALMRVAIRSAGELQLLFAEAGQTDHNGLAAAALHGLGDEQSGITDLGLYLDARIQHLLVDEFQDTNFAQFHLLEKLTAGWQQGDGRTLFLVGDPMQSIYRFREAEVGLFINARDRGVGGIRLRSLRLTNNFRARQEIVEWVNDYIGPNFPTAEDIADGAVTYAPSTCGRSSGGAVQTLAFADEAAEAQALVELVAAALVQHQHDPDFSAAIIVRGRSHLRALLPELQRQAIPYRAVKLDALLTRPVVQDLLALTRAIVAPADVTALLSVLRSPLCGLTLADLDAMAGLDQSLFDTPLERLKEDARGRAQTVITRLSEARAQIQRRPLRELVEGVWSGLGGWQACTRTEADWRDAQIYLQALQQAQTSDRLQDWNDFLEMLSRLNTEGDPPRTDVKLEILTIHGAKGLEWDLVVMPSLHRQPQGERDRLLNWLPMIGPDGSEHVLLAPLANAAATVSPPLNRLIRRELTRRGAHESKRLLYVAATRARERLVLSACLNDNGREIKPAAMTLLADLWPTSAALFTAALDDRPAAAEPSPAALPDQSLRRIAAGWQPPCPPDLAWQPHLPAAEPGSDIEYNWAGAMARCTGTILHRLFEYVAGNGLAQLDDDRRQRLLANVPAMARAMGAGSEAETEISAVVTEAFTRTLASELGRWILGEHAEAACELAISGMLDGQPVNAVIDRTFVDDQGVRWIIDYKSGYHAGTDLEVFIEAERERYAEQLQRYRRLFEQLEDRPVKTALYLPRHDVLLEATEPPQG